MGVRRINLETDEVEYDSSRGGQDLTPDYRYIREKPRLEELPLEEPRLEEIRHEPDWTHPLHPERQDKIILDDETLAKLRDAMEEYVREQREKDQ